MMSERTKNWLGVAGIIVLLAVAWSAVSVAGSFNASIQPSSFRSFSVSGEGKVTAVPDIAAISFSVIAEGDKNVGKLQQENTQKMNTIIAVLKKDGIESKDITTKNYSIQPREQYYDCGPTYQTSAKPCPPSQIVGYTISQSVAVKIRDFTKIGTALQEVAAAGANNISGLNFTIDDPSSLESQARAEAIKKAQEKARAVAAAGGFSLGRLLSIDEGGNNYQPSYMMEVAPMMKSASGAAPAPTIEAGSQDVKVSVTLRYEIR